MIGVIFMLNNKGPLMFINTVNTKIEDTKDQKTYDSRGAPQKKNTDIIDKSPNVQMNVEVNENKPKFIEERKIKNIIEMYQKNKPVLCNIITNNYEIVGIPYKMDTDNLSIKTSEDDSKDIKVNEIKDIIIIKF